MPFISLIVLLIDSRVPFLENIYLEEIKKRWPNKKILSIFTKSDLVPESKREKSFNLLKHNSKHKILRLILKNIRESALSPRESTNSIIVLGGANSGKSSFINLLLGSKKIKKSPEPGTTRALSRHKIPSTNLIIYDSPGLFPTKMDSSLSSLLQLLNFLPKTPDSKVNPCEWGYYYLIEKYPKKIKKLISSEELPNYYSFLKKIAFQYRLIENKGELSIQKAEDKFTYLIRKGLIGKILWEI